MISSSSVLHRRLAGPLMPSISALIALRLAGHAWVEAQPSFEGAAAACPPRRRLSALPRRSLAGPEGRPVRRRPTAISRLSRRSSVSMPEDEAVRSGSVARRWAGVGPGGCGLSWPLEQEEVVEGRPWGVIRGLATGPAPTSATAGGRLSAPWAAGWLGAPAAWRLGAGGLAVGAGPSAAPCRLGRRPPPPPAEGPGGRAGPARPASPVGVARVRAGWAGCNDATPWRPAVA